MDLGLKAMLLLLFSEVMDMSYECDKKEFEANKCIEQRLGKKMEKWKCCEHYYFHCVMFSTLSWCQNKNPKEVYELVILLVACSNTTIPTKEKCDKLNNSVDNCKQYDPSVCEDYTWKGEPVSTTTPTSAIDSLEPTFILSFVTLISIIIVF